MKFGVSIGLGTSVITATGKPEEVCILDKIYFEPSDFEVGNFTNEAIDITIPSIINGKRVANIGYNRLGSDDECSEKSLKFYDIDRHGNTHLIDRNKCIIKIKTLQIPEGVEIIKLGAFANCEIDKVMLPSTLLSIGESAFKGCQINSSVAIPDSVKSICTNAFKDVKISGDIKISSKSNLLKIFSGAFEGSEITKMYIPNKVNYIGDGCFRGCFYLQKIKFAPKIRLLRITPCLFLGCIGLREVQNFPKTVQVIEADAFRHTSIEKIDLGECELLQRISTNAFCGTNLKEVTIPSRAIVGRCAFSSCRQLEKVKLPYPEKGRLGSGVFESCSSLKEVEFARHEPPLGTILTAPTAYLPDYLFRKCSSLRDIKLPENTIDIRAECFAATGIEVIDLSEANKDLHLDADAYIGSPVKKVVLSTYGIINNIREQLERSSFLRSRKDKSADDIIEGSMFA